MDTTESLPRSRSALVLFFVAMTFSAAVAQDSPARAPDDPNRPALDAFGNVIPRPEVQRPVGLILERPTAPQEQRGAQLLQDRMYAGGELSRASVLDLYGRASPLAERRSNLLGPSGKELEQTGTPAPYSYPLWAVRPGGRMAPWIAQRQRLLQSHSATAAPVRVTGVTPRTRIGAWNVTGTGPAQTPVPVEKTASVERELHALNLNAHQRMRSSGWIAFQERKYRVASRRFQTATTLDPSDSESRIGIVFCEVSLGAVNTALAILHELFRREENPFSLALPIAGRYGLSTEADQQRSRSRLAVQAENVSPDGLVLHGFLLWFLGEPDDAMRGAARLGTDGGQPFLDWVAKMQAARESWPSHAP